MKRLALLVAVVGFVCLLASTAFGKVIQVPTAEYPTIQSGIDAASSGDTVEVAPGRYVEQISIFLKGSIVIQGAGAGDDPSVHSIIDGNGNGPVVTFKYNASPPTLDGFKVTNGNGGGMWIEIGYGTVSHCIFEGNTANQGGGMWVNDAGTTLDHVTFSGNTANEGAGLYFMADPLRPLTMTDCIVTGNTGDGMYQRGTANVTRCEFTGNSGDGLVNDWVGLDSQLTVTDSTFSDNGSDGMVTGDVTRVDISNSIFSGNGAAGIHYVGKPHTGNPQLDVTNCIFVKNGVAIDFSHGSDLHLRVTNSLFWGTGIALYRGTDVNPVTVTNCIIGGGSSIWPPPTTGYNVTYNNIEVSSGAFPGTGNINADPLFVDPDGPDNIFGTSDDDFRLKAGSPCIDAGTSEGAPAADMQGSSRFDDPSTPNTGGGTIPYYDIGAYEFCLPPCECDVDSDGDVDGSDLAVFASDFGRTDCSPADSCEGDLDNDGDCDGSDLAVFAADFGRTDCP